MRFRFAEPMFLIPITIFALYYFPGDRKKIADYANRKRPKLPLNYYVQRKIKKANGEVAKLNREIIVKEEQLERMRKSVVLMSKNLDVIDMEELEKLVSSDESENEEWQEENAESDGDPEQCGSNDSTTDVNLEMNRSQGVEPKIDRNFSVQYGYTESGYNRQYNHCGISLNGSVVATLKEWNVNKGILYDAKFVRVLLVNVFTTKVLAQSSLSESLTYESLDPDKIRFIRGNVSNTFRI